VAAVSVGVVEGETRLDLCYAEDKGAEVDANVVVAEPDAFVEVQGTGEAGTFSRAQLDGVVDLALRGTARIFAAQRAVLGW
jgi:ribonuclease PH